MNKLLKYDRSARTVRHALLTTLVSLLFVSVLFGITGCDFNSVMSSASTSETVTSQTTVSAPMTTVTTTNVTTTAPQTTPAPVTTAPPVVTTAPVTTQPKPETTVPPVTQVGTYKIDISKYWDAINPTGDLWDDAYLLLVNAANPIEKGVENQYDVLKDRITFGESTDYKYRWRTDLAMNTVAMKALSAMFNEAAADGIKNLDICSGYRSYSTQSSTFNNNCNKTFHWLCTADGCGADWIGKESKCSLCGVKATEKLPITREEIEANVATYSCAPGTSDHQTGFAVDIIQTSLPSEYQYLIQEFGETEAGKWLEENCYRFGFVLRFPADKEGQTGIIYEPWHFRYVGLTHATAMHDLNMCLEEYVEYLTATGYFG